MKSDKRDIFDIFVTCEESTSALCMHLSNEDRILHQG